MEHTFLDEPRITGVGQTLRIDKITVYAPRFPEFHYGDNIMVEGTIEEQRFVSKQNKRLIRTLVIRKPKIEAIEKENNIAEPLLAVSSFIRQRIFYFFTSNLPRNESGLLLGIVFGIKSGMDRDFYNQLRNTGVLHIVAASGMNVVLVSGFVSLMFSFLLSRRKALVLTILVVIFYAILAGLEPSIVRATIMGGLAFSAQILGRQKFSVYGLLLAAFFMLFISPNLLLNAGFQLSFMATLGLIFIRPLLDRGEWLGKIVGKYIIGEGIATTVSAQLATLPILLVRFGTYSLWSVLVNALVLWVVPILMVLGGLASIFGMILTPIGVLFLYLSYPFLLYFEKVISISAGLGRVVNLYNVPWQLIISYYLISIAIIAYLYKNR